MRLLLALALAACSSSKTTPSNRTPDGPGVTVELSGVTLGESCGDTAPKRAGGAVASTDVSDAAEMKVSPGGCADPSNCQGPSHPPCVQTSVQLAVAAPADAPKTTIRIKRVELLDKGKVVDTLAARKPSRWDDSGAYVDWDESVTAGKTIAASYLLAAPDWGKIGISMYDAHNKVFQLRVTIVVGDTERTIEKQSVTPAMIEPPIET